MGRFESTVEFYARYREPYPSDFFRQIADRLVLQGTERLIDVACGPAPLAIGFAPFVGSCVGLDPEPEMLASARTEAAHAGVWLELIQGRIEDLPAEAGVFNLVVIGRALHWLPREEALAVLDRIVAPGGWIAICSALAAPAPANPWADRFHEIRRTWSSNPDESCYHIDFDAWFSGSRFRRAAARKVTERHRVTVSDLIRRALSMSSTSPAVLGDRRPEFEAAMTKALEPFSDGGFLDEEVVARAYVVR